MSEERFIKENGNKMFLTEIKRLHNQHLVMNG